MLKKATLSSVYSGLQCCVCIHPQTTAASTSTTSPFPIRGTNTRHHDSPCCQPTIHTRGYRTHKKQKLNHSQHNATTPSLSWSKTSSPSLVSPTKRTYATVRPSSKTYDFRDNLNWPCCHNHPNIDSSSSSSLQVPTPYEIFELEKGGIYEKHKFYELVKMYHPDRNLSSTSASTGENLRSDLLAGDMFYKGVKLTRLQKLERYRLVVQAHQILSDPVKRRAYDAYGTGWGPRSNGPASGAGRYSRGYSSETAGAEGRNYGTGPEDDASPFANATWEDWERWYRRNEDPNLRQTYTGTYFNPNAFASFVILFAVISGVVQATRAGQYSARLEEKAQTFTEQTSRFLTERADQFNVGDQKMSADGRIKHFLQKRDPSRYGLKDEEEEFYRKHFAGDHMLAPTGPGLASSRNEVDGENTRGPSRRGTSAAEDVDADTRSETTTSSPNRTRHGTDNS